MQHLKTKISVLIVLSICILIIGLQKYKYPNRTEIQLKINYLSKVINKPFLTNTDISKLERQNSEWNLFTFSFASFALTNISYLDPTFKQQSIELIDLAIQKAITDTVYKCYFSGDHPFFPKLDTNGSVLYFGHLNMMLGCYRILSKNSKYNSLNDSLSNNLQRRFLSAKFKCLESYSELIWIPDNTTALASLKIHSLNSGISYDNLFEDWVKYAKINWIEHHTGLLCSMVNKDNGMQLEEARGSMIDWSIIFINYFDKKFAKELYDHYKNKFSTHLIFISCFKERYNNNETTEGDLDSGPIFLGYSIPANAFAFGDAVALKDYRNAKRLHRLIKLGSKSVIKSNELHYETRFVNMSISPLAESLILYLETMTVWTY